MQRLDELDAAHRVANRDAETNLATTTEPSQRAIAQKRRDDIDREFLNDNKPLFTEANYLYDTILIRTGQGSQLGKEQRFPGPQGWDFNLGLRFHELERMAKQLPP
jgi:hypothetical protein